MLIYKGDYTMSKGELPSFERNRFFYGKLLTVRDFQTEQDYFNEKRHLLNRLIHGSGVVSGLHVQKDGDKGFVISPGVAVDDCGREIVVNKSFTHSDIQQLSEDPEGIKGKSIYLSLQYEECLTEPIHVPSNSSCCQEVCESNRIKEGFKVKLTETALEPEAGLCSLLNGKTMIYENDNIRINESYRDG